MTVRTAWAVAFAVSVGALGSLAYGWHAGIALLLTALAAYNLRAHDE